MAKMIFNDGPAHGKLTSVEYTQEVDPQGGKLMVWVFSALIDKGNIHTAGEPVTVERRFYMPATAADAVAFAKEVGWNQSLGAGAKFEKPGVTCRATYKAPYMRRDGKPGLASNDFGDLMAEVDEAEVAKALKETFGALSKK